MVEKTVYYGNMRLPCLSHPFYNFSITVWFKFGILENAKHNMDQNQLLQTKQHYAILDGLRGIAAIAVVIFHFGEMAIPLDKLFIAHGFLAVDFFFCLSGFVIAYAYDGKMNQMSIKTFLTKRLIRLHPLVVLGSLLGVLAFVFDPFSDYAKNYSAVQIILLFLASALLIPWPMMKERYFNLFNLNAPSWSLFWEYIANIIYATVLCRLAKRWLIPITAIGAILLCYTAYTATNITGGWSGETFWHGGARLLFSFPMGMLLYRYRLIINNKIGFLGLSAMLFLSFVIPFNPAYNKLTEPLVVMLYYPLLIALGAGSVTSGTIKKLCDFSGKISYPLYMTHYMVMWSFMSYYTLYKPSDAGLAIIIAVGVVILIALAYVAMVGYENPVRKYLGKKLKQ